MNNIKSVEIKKQVEKVPNNGRKEIVSPPQQTSFVNELSEQSVGIGVEQPKGSTTEILALRKKDDDRLARALEKIKKDPASLTLDDFMLIKASTTSNSILNDTTLGVIPAETFSVSEEKKKEAIAENTKKGLEHARKAAETTPVVDTEHPSQVRKFEIRKIQLKNDKIALALYIDGEPWQYQPDEKSKESDEMNDFLMAHDILRHGITNRDRTFNTTIPMGEYGTGQVSIARTLLPANPMHYDGLIANAADAMIEKEIGSYSFQQLALIVEKFRTDRNIPVSSSLEIEFELPPPDIKWEFVSGKGPKTYYPLGDDIYDGNISLEKAKSLEETLKSNPKFSLSIEATESGQLHKYVEKTPADGKKLREVYYFTKDSKGQLQKAKKCWADENGNEIPWVEGNLINKGLIPTQVNHRSIGGEGRVYTTKKSSGRDVAYVFTKDFGGIIFLDSSTEQYAPVYTGHPYQSSKINSLEIKSQDGISIDTNTQEDYQNRFNTFKALFDRHQRKMKEILESGTLPIDSTVGGYIIGAQSYIGQYEKLVGDGILTPEAPITIKRIQEGIFESYQNSGRIAGVLNFDDEKLSIAPFPPPPYKK